MQGHTTHFPPRCIRLRAVFQDAVAARDRVFASMIPRLDVVVRTCFHGGRYGVCGAGNVGVAEMAVVTHNALSCGLMMWPKFRLTTILV